ncbi:hypothetical protein J2X45_003377 [Caulobacter sp. BE264]|uniref:hypothetical protein n=1 Tax=Caulobacter sp. BE264 TaxID=2817724 RepID=UPI00285C526A|nr:hypothetical protein [Caulobacter sp. BE264]MDR7232271.1 hypothetical protein [Caulobacter sp. BE264]
MTDGACHAPASEAVPTAREIILKVIGAKRLAAWCGVSDATPYQWLSRNGDEQPIPLDYAAKIVAGARAEKLDIRPDILFPSLAGLLA